MHDARTLRSPSPRRRPSPGRLGASWVRPKGGRVNSGGDGSAPEGRPAAGAAPGTVVLEDVHARHLRAIATQGDRAAFSALFRHYAPRIKSYLLTTGLPAMEAEELAQEAMLIVWRKAAIFDPSRAHAATWIFTIARNLRIDAARRSRAAEAAVAQESLTPPEPEPADDLVFATEAADRLRATLDTLPPDQLAVVRLSFFEDAPHPDIARRLGIPLGTVKSRLRLAMVRLRGLIDPTGTEP
ncbi:sigma-70 family RNA polymerase sigma factor [Nitrospirillum sp. BR 11163]|uniref:sigma-70 family RNA polymerase sigma factor n=1 Tax=Nitrospirillum sp. BR 11163 TaxID=3104323 RepID=UPI002AFDFC78|nr:sigma-70 family RNA polymerase sigma factor [Nitrospirillum sp. BR 11163]MEA1674905.1 sigma-70 family RNA polymerase sigma factor [Nitrospirillum sp. BR 11163]